MKHSIVILQRPLAGRQPSYCALHDAAVALAQVFGRACPRRRAAAVQETLERLAEGEVATITVSQR